MPYYKAIYEIDNIGGRVVARGEILELDENVALYYEGSLLPISPKKVAASEPPAEEPALPVEGDAPGDEEPLKLSSALPPHFPAYRSLWPIYRTVSDVAAAPDGQLLALPGVGPSRLRAIRRAVELAALNS